MAAGRQHDRVVVFKGIAHFRHRLILALLAARPVKFVAIRHLSPSPGLQEHHVNFLRLLEKLTQGTKVEISFTGTELLFHPGTLAGGTVTHQCNLAKSIGYYLEPLLAIAPWGKRDLVLNLKGVTTDGKYASIDQLRVSALPLLASFLEKEGVELRITKRGHPPLGGGEVTFTCPCQKAPKSGMDLTAIGRVAKIRGVAHAVRVSPQFANRLVVAARGVLNTYIPDIYIYTDTYKGDESGKSPGFALTLLSTSTSQVLHTSESSSCLPAGSAPANPDDLGAEAARQLLMEIKRGGAVDRGWEWLVLTLMALGAEDVGRVRIGEMEPFLIQFLRDLTAFLGTTVRIKSVGTTTNKGVNLVGGATAEEEEEQPAAEYLLSLVGNGFVSVARKTG